MPDALALVEAIFKRFAIHYGAARMAAHWNGIDPEAAKAYWAEKLACADRRMISYGLKYLPDHPPTVDEFLWVCRRCPPPVVSGHLEHKVSKEEWAASRAKAAEVFGKFRQMTGRG